MYVFRRTNTRVYTVGFYSPDGEWHASIEYGSIEEAAKCVHYLNGGGSFSFPQGRETLYPHSVKTV